MIYAVINIDYIVIILHFLSVFSVNFGLIFIVVVNMLLLESTVIFSVKRQNRYILYYGVILFIGMLILIIYPFEGVTIHSSGYMKWNPYFFIYLFSIVNCFAIIPIFYTSFKIYFKFETKELKRKWLYYLIGSLGLVIFNLYPVYILNLLTHIMAENESFLNILRPLISLLGISVVLWGSLMYYGIGAKLKK